MPLHEDIVASILDEEHDDHLYQGIIGNRHAICSCMRTTQR